MDRHCENQFCNAKIGGSRFGIDRDQPSAIFPHRTFPNALAPVSALEGFAIRYARLFIFAALPLLTGCTAAVLRSGFDTRQLETREDVRREFGEPRSTGQDDGQSFDEFQTRRQIAKQKEAWVAEHGFAATFGLFDLIAVPLVTLDVSYSKVTGQRLRFVYDSSGKITQILLNGDSPEFGVRRATTPKPSDDKPDEARP